MKNDDQIPTTRESIENWLKLMYKQRELAHRSLNTLDRLIKRGTNRLDEIKQQEGKYRDHKIVFVASDEPDAVI